MLETYLSLCTDYYEIAHPIAPEDAYKFYLNYATKAQGPILEPMCGTGRFLIPLMEAGFDIEGFDSSEYMLRALINKVGKKNMKPNVWRANLEDINLSSHYNLIFIPSGSFGLIANFEKVKICLSIILNLLIKGGTFVFEVETLHSAPKAFGIWKGSECIKPDGSKILLSSLDLPMQDEVLTTIFRYDLIENTNIKKTEMENFKLRLYEPDKLYKMLKEIGFSSIVMHRAFEHGQRPENSDEVVIFECKR